MESVALLLEAPPLRFQSLCDALARRFDREVEEKGKIWETALGRYGIDPLDIPERQPTAVPLVGNGRVSESVRHDDAAASKCGGDHLGDELSPCRREEEELGKRAQGHLGLEKPSEFSTETCGARFVHLMCTVALLAETRHKETGLGGFPNAFAPLEGYEGSRDVPS